MRTEPCVCGGTIKARSMSVAAVAVRVHNTSQTHVVWRLQREAPTAGLGFRDVSEGPISASARLVRKVS